MQFYTEPIESLQNEPPNIYLQAGERADEEGERGTYC